jgi:NAD(P)-dependent dehydrogenase (short-subunit alcohol dehydrogenase family)
MKLLGRVALVTGCSPNIGAGIAIELANAGAKVVCVDLVPALAQACADAIVRDGGDAIGVGTDVTNESEVAQALVKTREAFGGIDILVNGAVVQYRLGLLEISTEQFRKQLDVAVIGAFHFSKYAAQQMIARERHGVIINILSTEAHQGNPGNIGYGTAKGGLHNFTRSAAMELAPYGIRVNSLTPTGTDPSEGAARVADWGIEWAEVDPGRRPQFTSGDQGIPLGRRPSPSHYGKGAVFLASDDAEMITGFDLRVDAGTISRYWRWNPGLNLVGAK